MKVAILSFFALFLSAFAIAQNQYSTTNAEAIKYYARANQSIDANAYDDAITQLQKAVQTDPKFIEAHVELGDLYKVTRKYKLAIEQYRDAININPNYKRAMYLNLGEIEITDAQYDQARQHLEKYLTYPNIEEKDIFKAKKLILDCEFSVNALQHPVPLNR